MGADSALMPAEAYWVKALTEQINTPYENKMAYCTIWLLNGEPIGHCNVNKIVFGEEAYMHLHVWNAAVRQKGMGVKLLKQSLPFFFEKLQLKKLYCEPYALNPAPNKTLERAGFLFEEEYITVPGSINFEQPVKRWSMDDETFMKISGVDASDHSL